MSTKSKVNHSQKRVIELYTESITEVKLSECKGKVTAKADSFVVVF